MKILITGSNGLIGSEAVVFFQNMGHDIIGVDNNMRAEFFGPGGDTTWNLRRLASLERFRHLDLDVRDRDRIEDLIRRERFDLIVHAAAQPSHDLAAKIPFQDFEVNAVGTLNLLESCRRHAPEAVFILLSTNKVYGDRPNLIPLEELEERWEYADSRFENGIPETLSVDQCLHSLFGSSKLAADILTQEYGRYFGLKTGIFRAGCLTGPRHSGVELHGFLSYLVKVTMEESPFTIFGYKGKQVRDQIHSHDLVNALWHFAQKPRSGEVYNIGGGKQNSASILECLRKLRELTGKSPKISYDENARIGDHICYYSDLAKFRTDYPEWTMSYSLDQIIEEMAGEASSVRKTTFD